LAEHSLFACTSSEEADPGNDTTASAGSETYPEIQQKKKSGIPFMGSKIRPRMFMFKANIGYMEKVMFFCLASAAAT